MASALDITLLLQASQSLSPRQNSGQLASPRLQRHSVDEGRSLQQGQAGSATAAAEAAREAASALQATGRATAAPVAVPRASSAGGGCSSSSVSRTWMQAGSCSLQPA